MVDTVHTAVRRFTGSSLLVGRFPQIKVKITLQNYAHGRIYLTSDLFIWVINR